MIVITGSVIMRPECREAAVALGAEHSARSRAEPGCIAHNVHVDAEDDRRLVFLEQWRDRSAVEAHFAHPDSRRFVRDLAALSEGTRRMQVFEAIEVVELGRE